MPATARATQVVAICRATSSSTVQHRHAPHDARSRGLPDREQRCPGHGGHVRHRRGIREVLCRGDRHLDGVSPNRRRGDRDMRGERHRTGRVHRRQRRAFRGNQPRQRLGRVPHGRTAQHDVGPESEGRSTTGTRSTRASRTPRSTLFGAGSDSGTFDYFTDEINGEEGAIRTDYNPREDDNVTVTGVEGDAGRRRVPRALLRPRERRTAQGRSRSTAATAASPRRPTPSSTGRMSRSVGPCSSTSRPNRSHGQRWAFAQYYVENQDDDHRGALFIPLSEEQETDAAGRTSRNRGG